jgi:hypothetical protein
MNCLLYYLEFYHCEQQFEDIIRQHTSIPFHHLDSLTKEDMFFF